MVPQGCYQQNLTNYLTSLTSKSAIKEEIAGKNKSCLEKHDS